MFRELIKNELDLVFGGTGPDPRSYNELPGVIPFDFDLSDLENPQGPILTTEGIGGDDGFGGDGGGWDPIQGPNFSNPSVVDLLQDLIDRLGIDPRDTLTLNEGLPNETTVSGVGGQLPDGTSIFVYQDNGSTFAIQVGREL